MRYVDGYVLTVPKKKLKIYKKMATEAGAIWKKCGALEYVECIGDDLLSVAKWGGLTYPKLTKSKKGDTIIFSYVVYKSRKHRDAVNAKVHKVMEATYSEEDMKDMPFDMKRMAYGGFKTMVDL